MICGFTSRVIIYNFTTANEGQYTCNATHVNPRGDITFNSDSVYILMVAVSTGNYNLNIHE